nr:MADS-box transcription factor [Spirodela polyrhiza]
MGRRKIEIKRIENNEARHVTFSKRRTGLFKKLGELCIHCGAEAAALVYSPGGKLHVFAHPDEALVFDRFLDAPPASAALAPLASAGERESALRASCAELQAVLDAEKAGRRWWEEASLDGLGAERLRRLRGSVADLRQAVAARAEMARTGPALAEAAPASAASAGTLALPGAWPDFFGPGHGGSLQLPPGF